jgi:toxin ParE1/3/4
MGRQYEDLHPGLRGLPLDGYIIFYQIMDDGIEIVRVISGKRNLKSLFKNP